MGIEDASTFYAPTAFVPLGKSNTNNLFSPVGYGILDNTWQMYIYDRWGEMVFETNTYNVDDNGKIIHGWDGMIKNSNMRAEAGVYAWLVEYRDHTSTLKTYTGTITLIQ